MIHEFTITECENVITSLVYDNGDFIHIPDVTNKIENYVSDKIYEEIRRIRRLLHDNITRDIQTRLNKMVKNANKKQRIQIRIRHI
jgi:hypothetical protein